MDSKMLIATLALLLNARVKDNVYAVQRTKAKESENKFLK